MPFDYTVHHKDPKTGRVDRVTLYKVHVAQDKPTIIEQNGIQYYADGTPVKVAERAPEKVPETAKHQDTEPVIIGQKKRTE